MKEINTYIVEKLHLNKDIEVTDGICQEICDLISNYCKSRLNLKTTQWATMCEDDEGKPVYNEPNRLARVYLWSKDFRDIDTVAKELEYRINKLKKIKKTEAFVTSIYFYFE